MPKDPIITNKRPVAAGFSLAADEGAVRVIGPAGEDWLTIEAAPALSQGISGQTSYVALQTIGDFTKSLLVHAPADDESWSELGQIGQASVTAAERVLEVFTDDDADLRKRLEQKRAYAVTRAAGDIVGLLMGAAYEREVSDAELETHAQAAIDVFRVCLSGNAVQLDRLVGILDPPPEDDDIDLDEARARARLRLNALYRKIIAESLTVRQLREWGLVRQRVAQLREAKQLFAIKIPYHRELFHPAWQFAIDHSPREEMPALLKAAEGVNLDAIGFHQLMIGERSGSPTGAQLLDAGRADDALALIRATDR
jgi:hypothetical protein